MIPRNSRTGKSFAGIVRYVTHDPKANTQDRVAWTYTRNLANDFVPAAVNEMIWTFRDAETLKQDAGISARGRPMEKPVKHVSLNWAIEDNPSEKDMKETAEHFLKFMKWDEHQAIIVAHNDKPYKHVHIILNQVHPVTGRRLDDKKEQYRMQEWAAAYERSQGVIRCEQRELSQDQRIRNMPRNIWVQFQEKEKEFSRLEDQFRKKLENSSFSTANRWKYEWQVLKNIQRAERQRFYADGQKEFSDLRKRIYRVIREEFRERWADYYRAEKVGTKDDRAARQKVKVELRADQKAALQPRWDPAYKKLRAEREMQRDELNARQTADREEFRNRLSTGLDNSEFFTTLSTRPGVRPGIETAFTRAKHEVAGRLRPKYPSTERSRQESQPARKARKVEKELPVKAVGKRRAVSLVGSLLDVIFNVVTLGGANETRDAPRNVRDDLEVAAEEATKHTLQEARELKAEQDQKREKESWRRWDREYHRE